MLLGSSIGRWSLASVCMIQHPLWMRVNWTEHKKKDGSSLPSTYCCFSTIFMGLLLACFCHLHIISYRDRPKFGFGFGAEDNDLNCFGKFHFQPNIDLWLSANIRFRPKKFRSFGGMPKVHTAVTLYASSSEYLAMQAQKLNTAWNDPLMPCQPFNNSSHRIWSSYVFDDRPTSMATGTAARLKSQLKSICQHRQQAPQASNSLALQGRSMHADRRGNLLGDNAEKLLFLAYNIRLHQLITDRR